MASEQEILELAAKLGQMIGEHDAVKNLEAAAKAFDADITAQRAMTDYQRFAQSLQQKAATGLPIEVQDKQKLETLQQAVMTNPMLASIQKAEMDYSDLLRKVDAAIVGAGGGVTQPAPQGPPPGAAPMGSSILGG